jgi:hypothetical protein
MATAAEKRAWLRDNGYTPPEHGKLGADLETAFAAAHNGEPPAPPAADYPDDDFETAFAAEPGPGPDGDESFAETPPRRPKASSRSARSRGLLSRWQHKPATGGRHPAKRKHPRVSVESLISRTWGLGARLAANMMPPVGRMLQIQSLTAGVVLDPVIRGTVVDAALQPLARFEEKGKIIGGLAGPPVIVAMMTLHLQQCPRDEQTGEPQPNPVFMGLATEMLREALYLYGDVVGPQIEAAVQQARERERAMVDIDALIAFLFSPPPATAEEAAAEEAAIRQAQGFAEPAGV